MEACRLPTTQVTTDANEHETSSSDTIIYSPPGTLSIAETFKSDLDIYHSPVSQDTGKGIELECVNTPEPADQTQPPPAGIDAPRPVPHAAASVNSLRIHSRGKHGEGFKCKCGRHFDSPAQKVRHSRKCAG